MNHDEVTITVDKNTANGFKVLLDGLDVKYKMFSYMSHIVFYMNINWNTYYQSIKRIEHMIYRLMECDNKDITFQRMGFDYDDYEERSNNWNCYVPIRREFYIEDLTPIQ